MGDVVADFMAITGCADETIAIYCLSKGEFDLAEAMAAYQEIDGSSSEASPPGNLVYPPPDPFDTPADPFSQESPASPLPHTSSSPVQVSRLAAGGDGPAFPSSPRGYDDSSQNPVQRAFENTSSEPLARLFATPSYVHVNDVSFAALRARAQRTDMWLVLVFRDSSFKCDCFTRDVWNSDAMRMMKDNMLFYESDVGNTAGKQLAEEFRVDVNELPSMLLVDPQTAHCENKVPLRRRGDAFDVSSILDHMLLFLGENGSPSQRATTMERQWQDGTQGESGPSQPASTPAVANDGDRGCSEAVNVDTPDATPRPPVANVSPVSIDPWRMEDAPEAIRFRCRLPQSQFTLCLQPITPVSELKSYLAYTVYADEKAAYSSLPDIDIRTGFPPRTVAPSDDTTTVSQWKGVRSGDTLIVHIK